MPVLDDPRDMQSTIYGPINEGLRAEPAIEPAAPSALDVAAAASRQSSISGAAYARLTTPDFDEPDAPPDWDPLDHIQGYEDHAHDFIDVASPSALARRKYRIDEEAADRRVLERAGWKGVAAELGFTLLDPSFLVAAAVPETTIAKSMRLGKVASAAIHGATGAAIYETAMQGLQENRPLSQSVLNVGAGALLSGTLGKIINRVPKNELAPIRDAILAEMGAVSTVGAASVRAGTTLAQESIATGGSGLSKVLSKTPLINTDLDIIMNSESQALREAAQNLADVTPMLQKNVEGIATGGYGPGSAEGAVQRHEARVADFIDGAKKNLVEYKKRVPKDQRLTDAEFYEAISKSARRGDTIGIKEVDDSAKLLREKVFDPLWEDAKSLGLYEDPVKAAQARASDKAVEGYVKAEKSQIYADYRAKALSQTVNKSAFNKAVKSTFKDAGDFGIPEVEEVASRIRDRRALGTITKREENELVKKAFLDYEKRVKPLSEAQFETAALKGKIDDVPEAQRLSKLLREKESGQLAGRVTVPPVDEAYLNKVLGAKSYFRRMYDRELIRMNRSEWDQTLSNWFSRSSTASKEEVSAAVKDATDKILGNDIGLANFATKITVSAAGPLKERTLDIPDEMIEKFLINDPIKIARSYTRQLAPQVEIAKRFGEVDMKQALQNVRDEYAGLAERAKLKIKDPVKLNKRLGDLEAQEKRGLEALLRARNRVLGTAGNSPGASSGGNTVIKGLRGWRNLVASARLGGTAITGGIMDLAKVTAQYGFTPTMTKLAKLATSQEFRALSRTQARRVGAAVEVALSKRVQATYETAATEGWTDKLAHGVYKWTGLNHIMDFNRTLNAALFEDEVLKMAGRLANGKEIGSFARGRLASLGLGTEELKKIAAQVAKHGDELDGVKTSGSANWDDKLLADTYDAAILKESRVTIQQPGALDRAWWMDSEVGKVLGQLKSFALSAPSRLTTTGLQMAGQGNYAAAARFFGFMMIGGYLTHAIRQVIAGKKPVTDPAKAAYEGLVESGMAGLLPDLIEPPARLFGFGSARYSDRNLVSAYGGPGLGAMQDAFAIIPRVADGSVSASDLHAMRRLAPYNQVWWARRAINALEGETAEALDLKGAQPKEFVERMTETQ